MPSCRRRSDSRSNTRISSARCCASLRVGDFIRVPCAMRYGFCIVPQSPEFDCIREGTVAIVQEPSFTGRLQRWRTVPIAQTHCAPTKTASHRGCKTHGMAFCKLTTVSASKHATLHGNRSQIAYPCAFQSIATLATPSPAEWLPPSPRCSVRPTRPDDAG